MRRKSRNTSFKPQRALKRIPLRITATLAVLLIVVSAIFGVWYSTQDEKTRETVNLHAIDALGWLRDRKETPRKVDRWLDLIIDQIPASRGVIIDANAVGADRYTIGGLPVAGKRLQLLNNIGYVVAYDEDMKNPAWVAYRLTYNPKGKTEDRPETFEMDPRTRARIRHEDYTGSGFDRGHMAPNYAIGMVYGSQAQVETFLMSNIVPQQPKLNQGIWRLLEQKVAQHWLERFSELWVITGPIYSEPVKRLPSGVAVPSAFFKIIADVTDRKELRMIAVIMPQSATEADDMRQYLVSVHEVEKRTGLNFFSLLDDSIETELENRVPKRLW